mmetsp:Transcript_58289/g.167268  ORF Transcript_58289/g.167268 Transcript_58289/m.167268 type:complete len:208 (+) Transcript_58289:668-1291(+)
MSSCGWRKPPALGGGLANSGTALSGAVATTASSSEESSSSSADCGASNLLGLALLHPAALPAAPLEGVASQSAGIAATAWPFKRLHRLAAGPGAPALGFTVRRSRSRSTSARRCAGKRAKPSTEKVSGCLGKEKRWCKWCNKSPTMFRSEGTKSTDRRSSSCSPRSTAQSNSRCTRKGRTASAHGAAGNAARAALLLRGATRAGEDW